jgi:chaperonin cofactor prefoldin
MTETIFDGKTTPSGEAPANPQLTLPDEAAELIGEGKKYATVQDALKSVPHAQKHISTLEAELAQAREALTKAKAADEVYATVKEMLATGGKPPAVGGQEQLPDLDALLDRKLQALEAQKVAKDNTEQVKQALVAQFGDKAIETYRQKASDLGIGVETLNDLCAKSPKAALELLGVKPKPATAASTAAGSRVDPSRLASLQSPQQPKSVMGGASTSEVIAAWRAAKPTT